MITPQRTKVCSGYFMLPGSAHRYRDMATFTVWCRWKPQSRSPATCISTISPTSWAWSASRPASAHFGFGATHRHRHQRRAPGHPAVAGVEERSLQESGRPGVVPRRDRDPRHRPGLSHRDADAARAHGVHHRLARQVLSAAAGQGLPRGSTGKIDPIRAKAGGIDRRRLGGELAGRGQRHDPGDDTPAQAPPASAARSTRSPARPAPRRCSRSGRTSATRTWSPR